MWSRGFSVSAKEVPLNTKADACTTAGYPEDLSFSLIVWLAKKFLITLPLNEPCARSLLTPAAATSRLGRSMSLSDKYKKFILQPRTLSLLDQCLSNPA